MRKWHAILKDDRDPSGLIEGLIEEGDLGADSLKRFDNAAKEGRIYGTKIVGMWIIDYATEQVDVIRCWGRTPEEYHRRHNAYKEQMRKVQK